MKNFKAHLKYAEYVIKHKWYVFRAGLDTGAPIWRLIIHDWSKMSKAEWSPYVHFFNISKSQPNKLRFLEAFNHHLHRNPHHWQYWVSISSPSFWGDDGFKAREYRMPQHFVREMVADWVGAGQAMTGNKENVLQWYEEQKDKIVLHPDSRKEVETLLAWLKDKWE